MAGLDGPVNALGTDGTNLYAGGDFQFAGPLRVNGIARWDGTNWWSMGSGLDDSFSVAAIAVSGCNVYLGGYFTSVSGVHATNIARWNGSNWTSLGTGADDLVAAFAVKGNDVYAAGYFDVIDGVAAHRIAKYDGTSWAPVGAGIQGYCRGLKFIGDDLYANVVTGIERWDGHTWSALSGGEPHPEIIFAMEVAGQNLVVGANFRLGDGTKVTTIGRWGGSSWSILAPGLGMTSPFAPSIEAVAVLGSDIYVKGVFDGVANSFDVDLNGMARWDGSAWRPVGEGTGWYSNGGALLAIGNDLYAGGDPYNRKLMAKWDGTGWSSLNGQGEGLAIKGSVHAIAASGRNVYVGGAFSGVGNVNTTNLARWDGTNWSPFGRVDLAMYYSGSVDYMVATSNLVYIAGSFPGVNRVAATNIAKWDGTNWSALGNPPYGPYAAFAAQGEKAYVSLASGFFPQSYIYEWDGTNWGPLGGGISYSIGIEGSSPVMAFALSGTDVYIGGLFNEVGGVRATNLARWDGTNWWPVGGGVQFYEPGAGVISAVSALAVRGGELFVAGTFNRVGGSTVNNARHIAKWDGTNWFTFDGGIGSYPQVLALSGDGLYVGGSFETAGGQPARGVARWDGTTWSALGGGTSGPDYNAVHALAISGADIFVGGGFAFAGEKPATGFSIWHVPQALQFSRAGERLSVFWPTQAVDFVLETASTLSGAGWSTLPQSPQVVNGRHTVTIDTQEACRLFRLRRPY